MRDKLIQQAKCATVDACMNCDKNNRYGMQQTKEKHCPKCHVWKLVVMLKGEG